MGAGESKQEPQAKNPELASTSVCDFSEEQIFKLAQEIKKINNLIVIVKSQKTYDRVVSDAGTAIPDLEGANFANYMATLTKRSFEDKHKMFNLNLKKKSSTLILQHLFYAQVNHIL